jgi:hypothetical protein
MLRVASEPERRHDPAVRAGRSRRAAARALLDLTAEPGGAPGEGPGELKAAYVREFDQLEWMLVWHPFDAIVSTDRDFDGIPGLARRDPTEVPEEG